MFNRTFSIGCAIILAVIAFAIPARASNPVQATPNRAPDFVVSSGWVRSQETQLGSFEAYDNCLTYRMRVPVAPPGTLAVTYKQKPDYAYDGDAFVAWNSPAIVWSGGSWNCIPFSHYPNSVPTPFSTSVPCPMVPGACVDAVTAGAANNFSLTLPPNTLAHFRTEVYGANPLGSLSTVPAYQVRNYWDVQSWATVNGQVGGRSYHELWITPIADPDVHWTTIGGGTAYSHSVSYDSHIEARLTLVGWFVSQADFVANPAVLTP